MNPTFIRIHGRNGHLNIRLIGTRAFFIKRAGAFVIFKNDKDEVRALPEDCVEFLER